MSKYETFCIERGKLGPLSATEKELEIRPFTVFIGEQGTGKSLLSQLLYFFRNLPYLVRFYETRLGREVSAETLVRAALDNLRSDRRAIAVFADPAATVSYTAAGDEQARKARKVSFTYANRRARPYQQLVKEIARLRGDKATLRLRGQALFVPAERILYAQARGPSTWDLLALPATLKLFADAVEYAGDTFKRWVDGIPDTPQGKWVREKGRQALQGEAVRRGDNWLWQFGGDKKMDIDMASAGQKANWPLVILGEALFSWRREGLIDTPYYLHVEEPEIHLHPAAQVAMVELLAYLTNQGFNVVVTTHSLTVLYALNNLLVASDLGNYEEEKIPQPEVRLKRGQVGVYFCSPDGVVAELVDEATGLISEGQLAAVDEALDTQLNRLEFLRAYGTAGKRNV